MTEFKQNPHNITEVKLPMVDEDFKITKKDCDFLKFWGVDNINTLTNQNIVSSECFGKSAI